MSVTLVLVIIAVSSAAVLLRRAISRLYASGLADIRRRVAVARLRPRVFEPVEPDALYACEFTFAGCGEVARWRESADPAAYACDSCRSVLDLRD